MSTGVANQLADQQRVVDARGFVVVRTEVDNDISALNPPATSSPALPTPPAGSHILSLRFGVRRAQNQCAGTSALT